MAAPSARSQTGSFRRYLVLLFLVPLGYLFEVCVIPYVKVGGVSPNLLYVVIGIITVAFGKLRAFWVGTIYGLLMQIMLPSVSYLNLALYSLTTLFCSFAFADKPLKTIEYERATNRSRKELAPWLRTVLCAALNTLIYEAVNVTYLYIDGAELTGAHIFRAFLDVVLTSALTLILLFPIRRLIFGRSLNAPVMHTAPVVFTKH